MIKTKPCPGFIYVTLDRKTGMLYVGRKRGRPEARKDYFGSGMRIQRIYKKRPQDLVRYTIGYFHTEEESAVLERHWIQELHSMDPYGYNLCEGGQGIVNPCQASLDKLSAKLKVVMLGKNKGKKRTDAFKAKMRGNTNGKGKKRTDAFKAKMRGNTNGKGNKSNKGKVPWNKGKKCPQLSIAMLAYYARRRAEKEGIT